MSDKDEMTTSGAILCLLAILIGIPLSWALWGWALADVWRWFVVPLPFGLRALTRPEAFGFYLALNAFMPNAINDGADKIRKHLDCDWTHAEKMARFASLALGRPVVTWCVAWLAHSFIGWWWA